MYTYISIPRSFWRLHAVTDLANDLGLRLGDAGAFTNYSQVVFLAHSMGGLIVRQFLLRNRDELSKASSTRFVFRYANGGRREGEFIFVAPHLCPSHRSPHN